jgi:hypothetical protein
MIAATKSAEMLFRSSIEPPSLLSTISGSWLTFVNLTYLVLCSKCRPTQRLYPDTRLVSLPGVNRILSAYVVRRSVLPSMRFLSPVAGGRAEFRSLHGTLRAPREGRSDENDHLVTRAVRNWCLG